MSTEHEVRNMILLLYLDTINKQNTAANSIHDLISMKQLGIFWGSQQSAEAQGMAH